MIYVQIVSEEAIKSYEEKSCLIVSDRTVIHN